MNNNVKKEVNGKVNSKDAMPLTSARSIILRLMEASGASSDSQLANIFNINRQNISHARGKNKVPSDWILKIGEKYRYSLDWLQYGIGPKKRDEFKKDIPESDGVLIDENAARVAEQASVYGGWQPGPEMKEEDLKLLGKAFQLVSSKSIHRNSLMTKFNILLDALMAEEQLSGMAKKLLEMEKEIKYQNDKIEMLENRIVEIKKGDRRKSQRRQQDLGPPHGEEERRSGADRRESMQSEPQYVDKIKT